MNLSQLKGHQNLAYYPQTWEEKLDRDFFFDKLDRENIKFSSNTISGSLRSGENIPFEGKVKIKECGNGNIFFFNNSIQDSMEGKKGLSSPYKGLIPCFYVIQTRP